MKYHKTASNGSWIICSIIFVVVIVFVLFLSIKIINDSISEGVSAATESFSNTYEESRADTYAHYQDMAFELSEKAHHVSNRVSISISGIKEKSALEVLQVSDIVYIITEGGDNANGTTSWLKVYGTGVFTLNLKAAEYIVDEERQFVTVRVPRPVLEPSNISIEKAESLYFSENNWKPGNSVGAGEDLALNQLSEAKQRLQEDFEANEQYVKFAESSAQSMLAALLKGINPNAENLQVSVEFY